MNLRTLADSIDRVRDVHNGVYEDIARSLETYVTSIKEYFSNSNLLSVKYNRLLIKYYRAIDQIKEFEKRTKENPNFNGLEMIQELQEEFQSIHDKNQRDLLTSAFKGDSKTSKLIAEGRKSIQASSTSPSKNYHKQSSSTLRAGSSQLTNSENQAVTL